jgi:hypothetical protein
VLAPFRPKGANLPEQKGPPAFIHPLLTTNRDRNLTVRAHRLRQLLCECLDVLAREFSGKAIH